MWWKINTKKKRSEKTRERASEREREREKSLIDNFNYTWLIKEYPSMCFRKEYVLIRAKYDRIGNSFGLTVYTIEPNNSHKSKCRSLAQCATMCRFISCNIYFDSNCFWQFYLDVHTQPHWKYTLMPCYTHSVSMQCNWWRLIWICLHCLGCFLFLVVRKDNPKFMHLLHSIGFWVWFLVRFIFHVFLAILLLLLLLLFFFFFFFQKPN